MKSRICSFIKQETILVVSFVLALISCFFVRPDRGYLGYLSSNIGTIILLFCLMAVVAGLSSLGVFRYVGERLLERVSSQRGIAWMLIFLCFFASMFITNDVALITFVPFAIMILEIAGMQNRIVYTVTLMTIGANLGSMLTPMGNPQNLYLYSLSSMELSDFLKLMLPYTAVSAAGLWLCSVIGFPRGRANVSITKKTAPPNIRGTAYLSFPFLICMLTVSGLLPAPVLLLIITAGVTIKDRRLFQSVDYSLLATFLFFFIFIGNMNRFPPFRDLAVTMITGHEGSRHCHEPGNQQCPCRPAPLQLHREMGSADHWDKSGRPGNPYCFHGKPDFLQAGCPAVSKRERAVSGSLYLVEYNIPSGADRCLCSPDRNPHSGDPIMRTRGTGGAFLNFCFPPRWSPWPSPP